MRRGRIWKHMAVSAVMLAAAYLLLLTPERSGLALVSLAWKAKEQDT